MFIAMVHNEPMELQKWLENLPGSPTVSQAADHADVSKATFLRHAKKGATTAEYAISIARAYKVNEVQALVDLGFITADAVAAVGVENALRIATNRQLLNEINRRSDPEATRLFGKGPEIINPHLTAVHTPPAPPHVAAPKYDGTVREWQDIPHAADNSTDEQKAREERGEDLVD